MRQAFVALDDVVPVPMSIREAWEAVEALVPWAAIVVPVEGGFQVFESVYDYQLWERQT